VALTQFGRGEGTPKFVCVITSIVTEWNQVAVNNSSRIVYCVLQGVDDGTDNIPNQRSTRNKPAILTQYVQIPQSHTGSPKTQSDPREGAAQGTDCGRRSQHLESFRHASGDEWI
jgi:hypothetical protein